MAIRSPGTILNILKKARKAYQNKPVNPKSDDEQLHYKIDLGLKKLKKMAAKEESGADLKDTFEETRKGVTRQLKRYHKTLKSGAKEDSNKDRLPKFLKTLGVLNISVALLEYSTLDATEEDDPNLETLPDLTPEQLKLLESGNEDALDALRSQKPQPSVEQKALAKKQAVLKKIATLDKLYKTALGLLDGDAPRLSELYSEAKRLAEQDPDGADAKLTEMTALAGGALKNAGPRLETLKKEMTTNYQAYAKDPDPASAARKETLKGLRKTLLTTLAKDGPATGERFQEIRNGFNALKSGYEATLAEIAQETKVRAGLRKTLDQVPPKFGSLTSEQTDKVESARTTVKSALETPELSPESNALIKARLEELLKLILQLRGDQTGARDKQEVRKHAIKTDLSAAACQAPPGADPDEIAAIERVRLQLNSLLSDPAPQMVDSGETTLKELKELVATTTAAILQRQETKRNLEAAFANYAQGPAHAGKQRQETLTPLRSKFSSLAAGAATKTNVADLEGQLGAVKREYEATEAEIAREAKNRETIQAERNKVSQRPTDYEDPTTEQLKPISDDCKVVDDALLEDEYTPATTKVAQEALDRLLKLVSDLNDVLAKALEEREKRKQEILVAFNSEACQCPAKADQVAAAAVEETRQALAEQLKNKATKATLVEAERLLTELKDRVKQAHEAVAQAKLGEDFKGVLDAKVIAGLVKQFGPDGVEKVIADMGGKDVFGPLAKEYSPAQLQQMITEFGDAKKMGDFVRNGCGDAATFAKMQEQFKDVKTLNTFVKDGLGGKPKLLKSLFDGSGKDATRLKALHDQFNGNFTNLKALIDNGGFGQEKIEKPANSGTFVDAVKPECLGELLGSGCKDDKDPGQTLANFKAFCDGCAVPGAPAKIKNLLVAGGLGAEPEALAQLFRVGCGGKPADLVSMGTAFQDPDAAGGLSRLISTGGLVDSTKGVDGKPKVDPACLGQLLALGAGDPAPDANARAQALATLCKGLDAAACTKLSAVMKEGKLGKQPEAFGHVVGIACKGTAANVKDFAGAFDSTDKRDGLARLMDKGGLQGAKSDLGVVVVDPRSLARVVEFGGKNADTANMATRSSNFATLCTGLDDGACVNLGKLAKDGGLGTDPEVFGRMVGIGCQGDPAKLKALGTEFAKPGAAEGLKKLLADGGFVTKDSSGPTGVDAKCLAEMLHLGCEEDPEELSKLVKALNDTDRTHLKEMMKNGGLGTRPEVLGNSYKFGCLTDPYDPTSKKNPAMLKDLATAFGAATDAPKLKDLLDNGGLGDKAHSEWLGKVMRDAFTPRSHPAPTPPSGFAQDPSKLKDLHTAFNTKMPELKKMITAMGTMPPSCGVNDEPGKALQNVHKSAGVAVNQLKSQFYDKLDQRSLQVGVLPPPVGTNPPAPSLSLDDLIRNAASFEFDPVTPPPQDNLGGYDTDVAHVIVRHCRRAPSRQTNGNNNTSLFPKTAEDPQIRVTITASIGDCDATKATGPARPHDPPQTQSDLSGNPPGRQYKPVTGNGYTGVVGFKRKPPNGPGGPVQVGQYYPTGGPNVVTVNSLDLQAMKNALGR